MRAIYFAVLLATTGCLTTLLLTACNSSNSSGSGSSAGTSYYSGPGSHYLLDMGDSTFAIDKYTNPADTTVDFSVSGTVQTYSTGFKLLTATAASGTGGPSVGATSWGFDVPGFALFLKPIASGSDQILVAMPRGTCPTSNMTANWIQVNLHAGADPSSATQDIFGTFAWNASTGAATLPTKYNITSYNTDSGNITQNQSLGTGTCSNGIMSVSTASMYLTSSGTIVNTDTSNEANASFILGFNNATISGANFAGDYAGLVFMDSMASGSKITPIAITLTWNGSALSGSGSMLSNVATGATTGGTATFSMTAFNDPSAGFIKGTVSDGTNTRNVICAGVENAGGGTKEVFSCAGQDPGAANKLFNFIAVKK